MQTYRLRPVDIAVVAIVAVLTLSTAYIHYWVGGMMLMLNAAGYVTLVLALLGTTFFYRRALPLVLAVIAAYAAVTILGWLIMGPYFDVAYLAKAIEIVLIVTISTWLWLNRSWTREAFAWAATLPKTALGALRKPKSGTGGAAAGHE
jgi:hypothetical protein